VSLSLRGGTTSTTFKTDVPKNIPSLRIFSVSGGCFMTSRVISEHPFRCWFSDALFSEEVFTGDPISNNHAPPKRVADPQQCPNVFPATLTNMEPPHRHHALSRRLLSALCISCHVGCACSPILLPTRTFLDLPPYQYDSSRSRG